MTRLAPALLFAATLALSGPATADIGADGPPDPRHHADVDVLSGWRSADGTHMAALRIVLDDGWKTYWRAPGEAGIPPRFDWSGSDNLAAVGFHWPVPEVFLSGGLTTLGYGGVFILPFEVAAHDPDSDIALEGRLDFGICEDVCMPLEARVSAVLPAGASDQDPRIVEALAARPVGADAAGVAGAECIVAPIADGLRVSARIEMPPVGAGEVVVVEPADPTIWVSQAMVHREGRILTAETDLVPPQAKPFDLEPGSLRITVLAEGHGVDITGCTSVN